MNTEKIINPPSGYAAFVLFLVLLAATGLSFAAEAIIIGVVIGVVNFVLVLPGLVIVNPNESKVLTLFGKYVGIMFFIKYSQNLKEAYSFVIAGWSVHTVRSKVCIKG